MSSIIKTEALVFKKKSLLGKDVIITLFTETDGKVSAIAKGLKKITSRRASHIQTGNLIEIILNDRGSRAYLQESRLKSAFSAIKSDSQKVSYQYLVFFLLDRILPDRQIEPETYKVTKQFLIELARNREFDKERLLVYLHRFLQILGYHKGTVTFTELIRYIEEIIHEKIPTGIV